jgi:hypothetical protein
MRRHNSTNVDGGPSLPTLGSLLAPSGKSLASSPATGSEAAPGDGSSDAEDDASDGNSGDDASDSGDGDGDSDGEDDPDVDGEADGDDEEVKDDAASDAKTNKTGVSEGTSAANAEADAVSLSSGDPDSGDSGEFDIGGEVPDNDRFDGQAGLLSDGDSPYSDDSVDSKNLAPVTVEAAPLFGWDLPSPPNPFIGLVTAESTAALWGKRIISVGVSAVRRRERPVTPVLMLCICRCCRAPWRRAGGTVELRRSCAG